MRSQTYLNEAAEQSYLTVKVDETWTVSFQIKGLVTWSRKVMSERARINFNRDLVGNFLKSAQVMNAYSTWFKVGVYTAVSHATLGDGSSPYSHSRL